MWFFVVVVVVVVVVCLVCLFVVVAFFSEDGVGQLTPYYRCSDVLTKPSVDYGVFTYTQSIVYTYV